MKFSFAQISIVLGVLLSGGTLAASLGYSWPWTTAQAGVAIDTREQQHYRTTEQQFKITEKQIGDLSNAVSEVNMNTKEIVLLQKRQAAVNALNGLKKGSPAYVLISGQLAEIDHQLKQMGRQ